jgi:hypothetical protein
VDYSSSRMRRSLIWATRWSIVLLLPVLSWLTLNAALLSLLPGPPNLILRMKLVWFLGLGITFLAIATVGLVARRDAPDSQVANLLTGAFIANHASMGGQADFVINLLEYLVALGLGLGFAIGIWLWRRKRVLPASGL